VAIVAPGRGRLPVLSAAPYDVDADAELGVPTDALAALLDWLRLHLAAGLDGAALTVAGDAVDRALRGAVVARGRQRVTQLVQRLQSRFAAPGWYLEALRWPNDTAAELTAHGPAGARIAVRFGVGARGNRSQLGVDFGDAAADARVKPIVAQLVSLLRGSQSGERAPGVAA